MALPRRDVERALTQKMGMEMTQRDHRVYKLHYQGSFVAQTKVSRGSGHVTLGRELVSAMARDLQIPSRFFRGLVDCTRGLDDYLQHLRDEGAL